MDIYGLNAVRQAPVVLCVTGLFEGDYNAIDEKDKIYHTCVYVVANSNESWMDDIMLMLVRDIDFLHIPICSVALTPSSFQQSARGELSSDLTLTLLSTPASLPCKWSRVNKSVPNTVASPLLSH